MISYLKWRLPTQQELKELSVVGGDDNGGNVSPYSIKTSLITLTVITISITSTFSVGEACSWS